MTARHGAGSRERLSCSAELRHFGVWRAAIAVVVLAAVAMTTAWVFASRDTVPTGWLVSVAAAAGGVALLAASLARVEGGILRCDNGLWSFTPARFPAAPESGALAVAIDLGSFMLLSFQAAGRTRSWLPAQKRGLESGWHALRAAVHAPRPPAVATAASALAE